MPSTESKEPKELKKVLETVGKLVKLAQDGDTEEGRTAAIKALALIREHELVLVPRSELERANALISEAKAYAKKVEGEGQQRMMMGVFLGSMLGKKGLF